MFHVLFTDRAFNKICKLRRGRRLGSCVSSLLCGWIKELYIEQVFGDGFIFINLCIGSGTMAAFSHLGFCLLFPKKSSNSLQRLRGSGPLALAVCQSVLMYLLHMLPSASWFLYHFYVGISKMTIQFQFFPKKTKTHNAVLVTGSSGMLF